MHLSKFFAFFESKKKGFILVASRITDSAHTLIQLQKASTPQLKQGRSHAHAPF
jgi:hypothetical protein